ncbi:MAG: LysM peptidoglycan-binding domain-containing protein [Planctomycetota bacterium]|nr:LysM peptidoglycan-binding domain-containing protein [Planctomycetota bacterium]
MLKVIGGLVLLAVLAGGIYYYYAKDKEPVRKAMEEAGKVAETIREKAANPSGSHGGQAHLQPGPAGIPEPPNADVEGPPNRKMAGGQHSGRNGIGEIPIAPDGPRAAEKAGEREETVHIVAPGDTLTRIAKRYYGEEGLFTLIAKANKIDRPNRLKVGQKLVIPPKPPVVAPGHAESSRTVESPAPSGNTGVSGNEAVETLRPATLSKTVIERKQ